MNLAVLKRFVQVAGVLKKHHVLHLLFELNPSDGWVLIQWRASRKIIDSSHGLKWSLNGASFA